MLGAKRAEESVLKHIAWQCEEYVLGHFFQLDDIVVRPRLDCVEVDPLRVKAARARVKLGEIQVLALFI